MRQTIVLVIAALVFGGGVAQASGDPAGPLQAALSNSTTSPENLNDAFLPVPGVADAIVAVLAPRSTSPRPALLVPLYTTFAALQALDVDSTMKAIRSGAGREANPVLKAVVGSPAALLAVKAGTTAAIVLASERLQKNHHPVAAVVLMIGVNSAFAMVAAHNYSIARGRR